MAFIDDESFDPALDTITDEQPQETLVQEQPQERVVENVVPDKYKDKSMQDIVRKYTKYAH